MKKAGRPLPFIILGLIFGCLASIFWYSGANTFWRPISYFPYPVEKLLGLQVFGSQIWVETKGNEIFEISYPCADGQNCWNKINSVPSDFNKRNNGVYKISNGKCDNGYFVYPLFPKVKMCFTTIELEAEATWTTSLALTNDGKLWIWDNPWGSLSEKLMITILFTIIGMFVGLFTGKWFFKYLEDKGK